MNNSSLEKFERIKSYSIDAKLPKLKIRAAKKGAFLSKKLVERGGKECTFHIRKSSIQKNIPRDPDTNNFLKMKKYLKCYKESFSQDPKSFFGNFINFYGCDQESNELQVIDLDKIK